jgi:hypothetical protein
MRRWIAKYNYNDDPFEDEIRLSIEGTEYGFVGMAENGEELDLIPSDTIEDARDELESAFEGFETFQWLEKD